MLRRELENAFGRERVACQRRKAVEDRQSGFAVELLVEDGARETVKCWLAKLHPVRSDTLDNGAHNRVGGQDELVFDGASFIVDGGGELAQQLPAWHEAVALAQFDGAVPKRVRGSLDDRLEPNVYAALTMGVRDYVQKNRFPGVLVGLSGGIDSALTLAVAVDALGRERVRAVMLPSRYNAPMSLEDAKTMAGRA